MQKLSTRVCPAMILCLRPRRVIQSYADREEVYNTERHVLYVACTRARDQIMVSGVDPVSEFLEDLAGAR